jgi:hypothetical protein
VVNPGIAIVHAGTRQIYGRPRYLPVDERHPLRPVDVNGVNKMAGEAQGGGELCQPRESLLASGATPGPHSVT